MEINKMLSKIYYLILILVPAGWVLNWKYYFSRFDSEGFAGWLCVMISIILVIFASSIFAASNFFKKKKNKIWILFFSIYCMLAFYSINCTTAGQYWDQQIKNRESNIEHSEKDNQFYLVEEYKKKIEKAGTEYDKLNEVKNASIESLSDLYYYKNTTSKIEKQKSELKTEIKEYEIKIENILNQNKISIKEKQNKIISRSLYEFYAVVFKITGDKKIEKIQFIFQILLSIIIELIAQISIYVFMSISDINHNIEVTENKTIVKQNELKHFTVLAWEGITRKQSVFLTDKSTLLKHIKKLSMNFNELKYRYVIKTASRAGLIKKKHGGYIPGSNFVDSDYFYNQMCKIYKFNQVD